MLNCVLSTRNVIRKRNNCVLHYGKNIKYYTLMNTDKKIEVNTSVIVLIAHHAMLPAHVKYWIN